MKVLFLSFLLMGGLSAITNEVVQVFQPATYHDTDSVTEYGKEGELIQAAVVARPMVLAGAFPEDLVKAVALPFQFETNSPTYRVKEANLMVLCGLEVEVTYDETSIEVVVLCGKFKNAGVVELTDRQILAMTVEAIRRTLQVYYQDEGHSSFQGQIRLTELGEEQKELQDLDSVFEVGPNPEAAKE